MFEHFLDNSRALCIYFAFSTRNSTAFMSSSKARSMSGMKIPEFLDGIGKPSNPESVGTMSIWLTVEWYR